MVDDDSAILRHLRAGHDQRVRITEAVAAFRRLTPEDYGYFLATIEADLGGLPLELPSGEAPRLLAGPPEDATTSGTLRDAVLGLLADGQPRSTAEIRRELEKTREVNRASLNTEIFTLRQKGMLRSEGQGRGRRHTRATTTSASTTGQARASTKREPATRGTRRKRDDDEDHPARARGADAAQIYAAAIGDHHLLTPDEELELARHLEEVEIRLWERLLGGPLAAEARALLLELEEPIIPADAVAARVADLDRLVTSRVVAPRKSPGGTPPDPLEKDRAELRAIAAEADRIRDRFATCNLRLVPSTIRRYGYHLTTSLSMSDLIQEGNIGLLKAIPRFDHRRGLRFSTFATWWIRHYLVRARQNSGEVRVPVHLHDLASKAGRAKKELRKKLGRDPDLNELAAALPKVSKKSLRTLEGDWLKYREALPSFDSVGGDEGETPSYLASGDALADEVLARHEEDGQLAEALARMPPLLAQILTRRFGLGGAAAETLFEIAATMQLSRERIRQLEKKALTILRSKIDEIAKVAA